MRNLKAILFFCSLTVTLASSASSQTINITSAPYNATTGSANNAAAIQAAIAAVGSGGTVLVPSGTFLSGPLTLKSNMTFQIAAGGTLKMTAFGTFPQNTDFVYGTNLTNVTINGSGTMDGQGAAWWTDFNNGNPDNRPPAMIYLSKSSNVTLMGITVKDSPKFHVQTLGAMNGVYIAGVSITAAWPSPNTDGIDLRGQNYLIENSYISDGDDVIQIGGSSDNCQGITIRNCTFGTGHGLSIGGYTQGGVSNLLVDNCTFNGTQYGIRWKTGRDRGGVITNLTYSNITMTGILAYPFFLTSFYPNPSSLPPTTDDTQAITSTTPFWSNITLRNITASTASGAKSPGIMWAVTEAPVSNVLLDGVTVTGPSGVNFEFHHARGVTIMCNCRVDGQQPPTNVGAFDATISYPACGSNPTPTFTRTFTRTNTNTPIPPTNTFTATRTNTPIPPTNTFTSTATRTFTSTATRTFTSTNTPVPPTNTFTSTATRTFTSTNTFTATASRTPTSSATFTSTNTPVPPTNTFTFTPTRTFTSTSTNTPVPPTNTFTPTSTNSRTATSTNTSTPVPPTSTMTFTRTNTFTMTSTSTFTSTATATNTNSPLPPTNTFSATPSRTATPSATTTPTFTSTHTNTQTFTSTNTLVIPSATFTSTSTRTNTPIPPSATATPTSTNSSTPTGTNTFTSTNTPVPSTNSPTASFTATASNTNSGTATPTKTNTFTNTQTSTATATNTASMTSSSTPSYTSTNSPVPPTATSTSTGTATSTRTSTSTATSTSTFSSTFTGTSTATKTFTSTNSFTPTSTSTPTFTSTGTSTFTPTFTASATVTSTTTPSAGIEGVLFPNPATGDTVTVHLTGLNQTGKISIQLQTTAFRKIKEDTFHSQGPGTVDLTISLTDDSGAQLANGMYYVIVRSESQRLILKLMVTR